MRKRQGRVARAIGPGELALLADLRGRVAHISSPGLRLGIGDDCALLRLRAGEELAVTTDLSIAGRHFRLDWHSPESVGHRTLARGLSDLAAMGARPLGAFLSLGLPRELTLSAGRSRRSWVQRFFDGLLALAEAQKTPLAGGDLAESPIVVADIVLVGAVPRGRALLRSGGKPGDLLYVTGSLGGAAAGLAGLGNLAAVAMKHPPSIPKKMRDLLWPRLYPEPRVAQGLRLLRGGAVTAALDLSDGLSTDLDHMCEESGTAAEVIAAALPIHPAATLAQALHGGEDYELLFAASPSARIPRSIAGVRVTWIGRLVRPVPGRARITLISPNGSEPLEHHGWEHFS